MPSTRKSMNGCGQDGRVTTTRTSATTGAGVNASSDLDLDASCITVSVTELGTAAPGSQSAAPGVVSSEEIAAPGAAGCAFRSDIFTGFADFVTSWSVGIKMDSDSGEGLMDGFFMCS